jgi:type II secretory pathway component PulF
MNTQQSVIRLVLILGVVIFFCLQGFVAPQLMAQVNGPQSEGKKNTDQLMKTGPLNIKEKIAVLVFLSWLWLSIVVLVYLLIQKIREADRLHEIKYFESSRTANKHQR